MRYERVAPRDPVVAVVVLRRARTCQPCAAERRGHEEVVVEVLLAGAAGDGHRDRLGVLRPPRDTSRRSGRCGRSGRSRTRASRSGAGRSCPTGAAGRRKSPGRSHWACRQRERAEARAHPDRRRPDGASSRERGHPLLRQHARVAVRGGVHLVAVERRRQQRGAERRHLAERDQVVEEPQELRVARVLGPVVDEHKRQRLRRVGLGRRPDRRVDRRAEEPGRRARLEHRPPADSSSAVHSGAVYPGNSITDFSPNAPGARSGFVGSGSRSTCPSPWSISSRYSRRSTGGARSCSSPAAAVALERHDARLPQLVRERDAGIAVVREREQGGVVRDERRGGQHGHGRDNARAGGRRPRFRRRRAPVRLLRRARGVRDDVEHDADPHGDPVGAVDAADAPDDRVEERRPRQEDQPEQGHVPVRERVLDPLAEDPLEHERDARAEEEERPGSSTCAHSLRRASPGNREPFGASTYTGPMETGALEALEFPAVLERLAAATATPCGEELARG